MKIGKRRIGMIILLVICAIIFLIVTPRKTYLNRTKAVICLNDKIGTKQKLTKENEIVLEECREYIADYDEENQTILYVNNDRNIVQRDRITGMEHVITFEEVGIDIADGTEVHNLQYAPGGLSFVLEDSLYLWERDTEKVSKVLDSCVGNNGYNTYQWCGTDKVYFLSQGSWFDLNVWYKENHEINLIQSAVRNFIVSDNENMIYQISYDTKYYEGLIDMKYNIVELDAEDGTSRQLMKFDSEDFSLEVVDDRYLYYVQKSSNQKMSKIYCYDLETDKKKCVYRTDKEIVGIIK